MATPGSSEKGHRATTVKHYQGVLHRLGSWFHACGEGDNEEQRSFGEIAVERLDARGNRKFSIDPKRLYEAGMEPFYAFVRSQTQLTDEEGEAVPAKMATLSGYRAAVNFAFAEAGLKHLLDAEVSLRMQREFQDARAVVQASPGGAQPAMSDRTVRLLSQEWLKSHKRKHRFARAFLLVQWNTCTSSSQAAAIDLSRIVWSGDSCVLHVAKNRQDQPHSKHRIFANPADPVMCPLLALGLHLLEWDADSTLLFPGSSQDARFSNTLRDFAKGEPVVTALVDSLPSRCQVQNPRTLRNGAALVACGLDPTHETPARSALDKYTRNQQRGDGSFAKRLAGLRETDPEYSAPPPSFPPDNEVIEGLIHSCFSPRLTAMTNLVPVLRACLAQMVHHDTLPALLSTSHPATKTSFFSDPQVLGLLRESLISSSNMVARGRMPEEASSIASNLAASAAAAAAAAERALAAQQVGYNVSALDIFPERGDGNGGDEEMRDQSTEAIAATTTANQLASRLPHALAQAHPLLQSLTQKARELQAEQAQLQESLTTVLVQPLMQGVNKVLEDRNMPPMARTELTSIVASAVSSCLEEHVNKTLGAPSTPFQAPAAAAPSPFSAPVNTASSATHSIPPPVSHGDASPLLDSGEAASVDRDEGRFFYHGPGRYLRVPPAFKLPRASVREAWMLWFMGDPIMGVMAFRRFTRHDLSRNKPLQSVYSEWRKVLGAAERYLQLEGKFVDASTHEQVAAMLKDAMPFIDLLCERAQKRGTGRNKRPSTILALSHRLRVFSDEDIVKARDEIRAQ